jgi:hypothetical protein
VNEKAWHARLRASLWAHAVISVKVLLADSAVRADLIPHFYERKDTRNLAEVLIDLESDDVLRVTLIRLLGRLRQSG